MAKRMTGPAWERRCKAAEALIAVMRSAGHEGQLSIEKVSHGGSSPNVTVNFSDGSQLVFLPVSFYDSRVRS